MKILAVLLTGLVVAGCNRDHAPDLTPDTIRAAPGSDTVHLSPDTAHAPSASADTTHSDLPPVAHAIEPDKLASYLPKMNGWTPTGELQKEIQIHDTFNKSRVAQTYTDGSKKLTIEINDFAYVPYLYDSWTKFKGNYLDDDNIARTETSTVAGYHAVQSMEKKDPHGEVTVFPGKRFVVRVIEEGAENIEEVRSMAQRVDLHGLEAIQ